MKQLLIKVPDELMEQLNNLPNKSQTVREAIEAYLSGKTTPASSSSELLSIEAMLDVRFAALLEAINSKLTIKPTEEFVPKAPDPITGYACCLNEQKPCKHWAWDGVKQSYTNNLTGEVREIYL
jgi:hypothetical protein